MGRWALVKSQKCSENKKDRKTIRYERHIYIYIYYIYIYICRLSLKHPTASILAPTNFPQKPKLKQGTQPNHTRHWRQELFWLKCQATEPPGPGTWLIHPSPGRDKLCATLKPSAHSPNWGGRAGCNKLCSSQPLPILSCTLGHLRQLNTPVQNPRRGMRKCVCGYE